MPNMWDYLDILKENASEKFITTTQIKEITGIDDSNITQKLNRLLEVGFIERKKIMIDAYHCYKWKFNG